MKTKTLKRAPIYFGCDPEFFFKKGNKIIGAEKVLPADGLINDNSNGKVIIDGVQAELNPLENPCREVLANRISRCLCDVRDIMKKKKVKADFSQTVKISKKEMDSLSEKSKQFGCSPSNNMYNKDASVGVKDASIYMSRSAGGHVHIGMPDGVDIYSETYKVFKKEPERLVQMLDIIVGNTMVMIDRDKGNIERRKTYGRAGEYRLPSHGLEYRTLSNFWLTNYTLMSFVMSMTRLAVSVVCYSKKHETSIEDRILNSVNMEDIAKAINENDFDLAKTNFDKIKTILVEATTPSRATSEDGYNYVVEYSNTPIKDSYLPLIEYFVSKVKSKGLSYWFEKDIIKHWTGRVEGRRDIYRYRGWESFLEQVVAEKLSNKKS